jgi:hypothetical protein
MNKNFLSTLLRPEWRRKASPGRAGTVVVAVLLCLIVACSSKNEKPCYVAVNKAGEANLIVGIYFIDSITGLPLVGDFKRNYTWIYGEIKFWEGFIDRKKSVISFESDPYATSGGHQFYDDKGVVFTIRWYSNIGDIPEGWPAPGTVPNGVVAYQTPNMSTADTLSIDHYECGEAKKGYARFYINRKLILEAPLQSPVGPGTKMNVIPIFIKL